MTRTLKVLALGAVLAALVVTPSSAAVKPKTGKWKGRTAQGTPVEFVLKKKGKRYKVVKFRYTVQEQCIGSGIPGMVETTSDSVYPGPGWKDNPDPTVSQTIFNELRVQGNSFGIVKDVSNTVQVEGEGVLREELFYNRFKGKFQSKRKAKGLIESFGKVQNFDPDELVIQCEAPTIGGGPARWQAHR